MPPYDPAFWPETLKDWVELIVAVIGIITAVVSAYTYYQNSKESRAKWLSEMYHRYYGNPDMRLVRIRLNAEGGAFVKSSLESTDGRGRLDDYLNFFEFVGYLYSKDQLSRDDIKMFKEPLKDIADCHEITSRLAEDGFERLSLLLKAIGRSNNP